MPKTATSNPELRTGSRAYYETVRARRADCVPRGVRWRMDSHAKGNRSHEELLLRARGGHQHHAYACNPARCSASRAVCNDDPAYRVIRDARKAGADV